MNQQVIDKYLEDIDELGFEKNLTLNSEEVAEILRVGTRTLDNWRKQKIGPIYKKIGKAYLYNKRDVAEFLAKN